MKLPQNAHYAAAVVILSLLLILTGCSKGYQLRQKNGVETLYHTDESGTKRIVYVVNEDGRLQVHNENDPLVKRIYADRRTDEVVQEYESPSSADDERRYEKLLAARLIRMGRLLVAQKRQETDPIFVTIKEAETGPTGDADQARDQYSKVVTAELERDEIITISPKLGDVDIFIKSYVRETAAVNIRTQKLVTVTAFYFEALVRSNFHPEESHTICELGHMMDRQEVIKRTALRLNKVIKELIGPNIPKDRTRFLPSNSQGV